MLEPYPAITIYDREIVLKHFDEHPNASITLDVPASGSWCETFDSKEQYLARMDAWDRTLKGEKTNWYELRGRVSHPWMDEWDRIAKEDRLKNPRSGSI